MLSRQAVFSIPLVALISVASAGAVVAQDGSAEPSTSTGGQITVTGSEYAFGDLPASVPAGTSLAFTNTGEEVHELILARKNDGVTETWEELLALPEEEALQKVTTSGPLLAAPGEAAAFGIGPTGPAPMSALTVDQPGDYLALCAIPQGLTELPDFGAAMASSAPAPSGAPASMAPQGPPHFVLGMFQEFTVTA